MIGNVAHFKIKNVCSREVKPLLPHSYPHKLLKCLCKLTEHEKPKITVKVLNTYYGNFAVNGHSVLTLSWRRPLSYRNQSI